MILSSTANGTYKRGELRWVRNLHQIMLILFGRVEGKSIRKMRPKTLSVLEVPRWYFYDLGTLQGRLLQICENFEYPSPFDYCELSSESMHF